VIGGGWGEMPLGGDDEVRGGGCADRMRRTRLPTLNSWGVTPGLGGLD